MCSAAPSMTFALSRPSTGPTVATRSSSTTAWAVQPRYCPLAGDSGRSALGTAPPGRNDRAAGRPLGQPGRPGGAHFGKAEHWCTPATPGPIRRSRRRPAEPIFWSMKRPSPDSEIERARETGHSTAREAAEIARDAGVRRLVLHPHQSAVQPGRG